MAALAAYHGAVESFKRVFALRNAMAMLDWDRAAMMPSSARTAGARAEMMALLKVQEHEALTSGSLSSLLATADVSGCTDHVGSAAADRDAPDSEAAWQQANLRLMRREVRSAQAMPAPLVQAMSQATSACHTAWLQAKPESDWEAVREPLSEVFALTREAAAVRAETLSSLQAAEWRGSADASEVSSEVQPLPLTPYDALMDQFDPGAREADATRVFEDLASFLAPRVLDWAMDAGAQQRAQEAKDLVKSLQPCVWFHRRVCRAKVGRECGLVLCTCYCVG